MCANSQLIKYISQTSHIAWGVSKVKYYDSRRDQLDDHYGGPSSTTIHALRLHKIKNHKYYYYAIYFNICTELEIMKISDNDPLILSNMYIHSYVRNLPVATHQPPNQNDCASKVHQCSTIG